MTATDSHTTIRLLDVVALTRDVPAKNLRRGQVGTVVAQLAPGVFEVEFSDDGGRTFALASVPADHLIVLRYFAPEGTADTVGAQHSSS